MDSRSRESLKNQAIAGKCGMSRDFGELTRALTCILSLDIFFISSGWRVLSKPKSSLSRDNAPPVTNTRPEEFFIVHGKRRRWVKHENVVLVSGETRTRVSIISNGEG